MSENRCPECRSGMTTRLVEQLVPGTYLELYSCVRRDRHKRLVTCSNCGEDVPGPDFHVTYTAGLIGSRRWTCASIATVSNINRMFNPDKEPNS